jgi:exportin-5
MVNFATKALTTRPGFAVAVLDYILSTTLQEDHTHPKYADAVKNLQHSSTMEMQKLAMCFADHFLV